MFSVFSTFQCLSGSNGQRIAMRTGEDLYYLHGDPAHTMLAVSDAQGSSQGHLWYDPHGSVLSSTLPMTLTEHIGLDSRLGLVYHGDGRYYDPAIAHTLQPDPFGGVPQLPQTLNRYAVPPAPALSAVEGGSVMGQAGGLSWWLNATLAESAQGVTELALGKPLARRVLYESLATGKGTLFATARYGSLARGGILKHFEPAYPGSYLAGEANVWRTKGLVRSLGKGVYFDPESGEFFALGKTAWREGVLVEDLNPVLAEEYVIREVVEDSAGKFLLREAGIPFILDFSFQLAEDWSNPRLTGWQKAGRATVSGGVGVGGGLMILIVLSR